MPSLHTSLAFLFWTCLVLGAAGCTSVVDDPGTLPYHEKLVVRGVLQADSTLDTISVTRTLPPLDDYSREKAAVHGALVVVYHNGVHDTLRDHGKGRYFAPNITIQSGTTYELTVEWNGKRAYATTIVPFPPIIQSVRKETSQSSHSFYNTVLVAAVTPRPNEVYGATSEHRTPPPNAYTYRNYTIDEVKYSSDTTKNGTVSVRADRATWYQENGTDVIQVHAYDPAFYAYFRSAYDSDDDSPFNRAGSQKKWNIYGDGIGMFIGMASSPFTEVP